MFRSGDGPTQSLSLILLCWSQLGNIKRSRHDLSYESPRAVYHSTRFIIRHFFGYCFIVSFFLFVACLPDTTRIGFNIAGKPEISENLKNNCLIVSPFYLFNGVWRLILLCWSQLGNIKPSRHDVRAGFVIHPTRWLVYSGSCSGNPEGYFRGVWD